MASPAKSTPIQQLPQMAPPSPGQNQVEMQPPQQQPPQQPMATPMSQLPQQNDSQQQLQIPQQQPPPGQQIPNDNNQIVNEILSEIENTHLQEAPEDSQGGNIASFQRHMDDGVNYQNQNEVQ